MIHIALLSLLLAGLAVVEEPEQTLFWKALFDAGHAFLFGLVVLLVRSLLGMALGEGPEARRSLQAIVVTLGLAAASEILQLFQPTRDASVADFLRDAAGATAFPLLGAAIAAGRTDSPRQTGARRAALGLVGAGLLSAVAVPFLLVVRIYIERDRAFPTLFRLDGSRWERQLVSTGNSELVPGVIPATGLAETSRPMARLALRPGTYPGLVLHEPYPDWRGFNRLVLTVLSEVDAPLALTIRVHDVWHDHRYEDRFNKKLVITRGEHLITIPLEEIRNAPRHREMDLRRVRGIVMYAYRLGRRADVYLGPIRLE
jgi:VanZ family protein